jgi:GNAT superfamily N-acetyltransferase
MSTAGEIQIREAKPEDAETIATVLYESFIEFRALYTDGGFAATTPNAEQIRVRMREGPVWVAICDSIALGTVAAVVKGTRMYMRGMAVLPSARGSGIAARMLEVVEERASRERCGSVFLSTTPFLSGAIRLYEGSGFRRTEEGPHDLSGTPLFTMEKNIDG